MAENRSRPDILAIIPARGGSKGVPRKNIRALAGRPLMAYTIEHALHARQVTRTVVSTDDAEIADIARRYGAEVIRRPLELAQDDTPSLPVLRHVIGQLADAEQFHPDIIVVLQPTSPLRTVADIETAIEMLVEKECGSVVSVCEVEHPLEWMYTLNEGRLESVIKGDEKIARRQDASRVYRLNGAVYVTSKHVIMKENRVLGRDTRAYIMPSDRSVDIDSELDFALAELLVSQRQ